MKPISKMTQGELAAYIDSHLKERGIAVVLSGGAAVAVYSGDKYVSKDLDFVPFFPLDHDVLASIMMEIGFESKGRYYFHPDSEYFVEFVSGPPTVGSDPIKAVREIHMGTGIFGLSLPPILSKTDSPHSIIGGIVKPLSRRCLLPGTIKQICKA